MDEDKLLHDTVVEASKEIAKETYNDVAKPSMSATGKILGLIPRTINAVLSPLEKWILQKEYNIEETKIILTKRLENIPLENIVSPEPYIAVPALQQISYAMDNENLREMYANLLAKAMNKETKNEVHPSFVEIIKQLSPDEALLLKYIYTETATSGYIIPALSIIEREIEWGERVLLDKFSNFPQKAGCKEQGYAKIYFDNLERLSILSTGYDEIYKADEDRFNELENEPYILDEIDKIKNRNMDFGDACYKADIIPRFDLYQLTQFGIEFCKICIQ